MDSERTGYPGGRVCESLRGLRSVFCSQSARRRLWTGRAHVLAWGTPRSGRFAFDAQGDVMAARVVGIQQEGVNPCRMVPSREGRGTRQLHDITGKVQRVRPGIAVRRSAMCELPRWNCAFKKK